MNYQQVIGIFKVKTQLKNVEEIKLCDGKIELNFFKSIVKTLLEKCHRIEFSAKSNYAWHWNNVSIGKVAELLSSNAFEAAKFRAEIITPRPSKNTIKSYLADIIECPPEKIDENQNLRSLTLPVCGYQEKSYLTAIIWLENAFDFITPPDLVNRGTIKDLIDYIADQ